MTEQAELPPGYSYEPSISAFVNHIGRVYSRRVRRDDGDEIWAALRVESHHVNAWNLCHGAVIASLAEVGTASASWDPTGPPIVAVEMSMQFIAAPKLGDLIEVKGTVIKRTRSMVFTRAEGEIAGKPVIFATSVQKVLER